MLTGLPLLLGSVLGLCAGTPARAATTPQAYALLQTPAADPFNFGGAVVAGPNGVLFGTVGDSLYALTPPTGAGSWTSAVIGRAWTTGDGSVADGFSFSEGKVAVDASGAVYAATSLSLETGGGILKFTPPAAGQTAWTKTVIWTLKPGVDGAAVNGGLLVDPAGMVYATLLGGSQRACFPGCQFGSVLRLAPPTAGKTAWTALVLHHFMGGTDGEEPDGTLFMNAAGVMFGTAGGGASGNGIVYRLVAAPGTKTGWTISTVYTFTGGADGSKPTGGVVQDGSGSLFGVTRGCVSASPCNNIGSIYRLQAAAGTAPWGLTTLAGPLAFPAYRGNLLVDHAGTVYGAANYPCSVSGISCGVVFSLAPAQGQAGWTYTPLADLGQDGGPRGLTVVNGVLYGAANQGAGCATASGGCTTVFALSGSGYTP